MMGDDLEDKGGADKNGQADAANPAAELRLDTEAPDGAQGLGASSPPPSPAGPDAPDAATNPVTANANAAGRNSGLSRLSRSLGRLMPFGDRSAQAARNRWLPEGRRGPMPWIIAIMMFLTLLAGAVGLSLGYALTQLHGTLSGGHTIQIVEANAEQRATQVSRVANMLRGESSISTVRVIPESELLAQLEPWIGTDIHPDELPIPALIDIKVAADTPTARMEAIVQKITAIAPSARMDAHEAYMGPIERLMRILMWVAAGAVALMVLVTWAVVMLAARSAHATHRATIDIMHLLGATDLQIARLFQRRMALDAIFGSLLGSIAAGLIIWLLHRSVMATEAELAYMMTLPPTLAIILIAIPLSAILLAMVTARITVRRTLERTL